NAAPSPAISTLSLHDALPIFRLGRAHHGLDGGVVDLAREGHDAAERRAGVAVEGSLVGVGQGVGDGGAARVGMLDDGHRRLAGGDRKSTRLNSSHVKISYAVF